MDGDAIEVEGAGDFVVELLGGGTLELEGEEGGARRGGEVEGEALAGVGAVDHLSLEVEAGGRGGFVEPEERALVGGDGVGGVVDDEAVGAGLGDEVLADVGDGEVLAAFEGDE